MKLSEYVENLTAHLEDCKSRGVDPECYYVGDDEGNGYQELYFFPSKRYTDKLEPRCDILYAEDDLSEEVVEDKIEVVIIN